jgi:hypothetical protein
VIYRQVCHSGPSGKLSPLKGIRGSDAKPKLCPSVPSMGRISLDERSQPEPMTVTVVNRKA